MHRHRFLLLIGLVGCDRPSPLGAFARDDLSKWASDCEQPIVEENPRDPSAPGPTLRDGGPAFTHATRRYRCPPPGWAVYADSDNRVVGLCVDNDTRPFLNSTGTYKETVDHEVDRARRLITAHWSGKLASEMLKDLLEDHCPPASARIAHGMLRWGMTQLTYPNPEKVYSQSMCCWEVEK